MAGNPVTPPFDEFKKTGVLDVPEWHILQVPAFEKLALPSI
jgi:hypothetical protein